MAIFTVTSNADTVNANDGVLTLREAITLANANQDVDTILFSPALGKTTISLQAGQLNITGALIIEGDDGSDGTPLITIDADPSSAAGNQATSRVFAMQGFTGAVDLENLNIVNGRGAGDGGAIFADTGVTLLVGGSTIANNTSTSGNGGGIFAAGVLGLDGVTVTGNSAAGAGGGVDALGTAVVSDSTFTANKAQGAGGGAAFGGVAVVGNSTFSQNVGVAGGGAAFLADGTITDSQFSDNEATGLFPAAMRAGGGIVFIGNGDISIDRSFFTKNRSAADGGGIATFNGDVAIANSTLSGNDALFGGGLFSFGGGVAVTNSTIAANTADFDGAGLYAPMLSLNHATITGNQAGGAGGGAFANQLTMNSSIAVGNAANGLQGDLRVTTASNVFAGVNLVGAATISGGTSTAVQNGNLQLNVGAATLFDSFLILPGTAVMAGALDPDGFVPLGAIQPNPAIDGATGTSPATDQRGFLRLDGNGDSVIKADIGAFEFTGLNTPPDAVNESGRINYNAPVTVAVLANDTDPNGGILLVTVASDPLHGTTVINAGGTITYTPDFGYRGSDTFTYTISDSQGGSDTATVSLAAPAVPPQALTTLTPGQAQGIIGFAGFPTEVLVTGTAAGAEIVTIGDFTAAVFSNNFANGGDTVRLAGRAGDFDIAVSGNQVSLTSMINQSAIYLPVGFNPITIVFETAPNLFNDSRTLKFMADGADADTLPDLFLGPQRVMPDVAAVDVVSIG